MGFTYLKAKACELALFSRGSTSKYAEMIQYRSLSKETHLILAEISYAVMEMTILLLPM